MIGFLLIMAATFMFMLLGYTLLTAPFILFINIVIIFALIGMATFAIYGAVWEFYFQQPAKHIIANRRAAAWEWAVDDLGYAQLVPSKQYLPHGLVQWKFGWNLLPRPLQKFDIIEKITGRPRGRLPKDPEQAKRQAEQRLARERQMQEVERRERELAEQIGLKKCTWKGIGKPIWFNYLGLAANFNPYILVPSEAKQDNPHLYLEQMRAYVQGLINLSDEARGDLLEKIAALESHLEHVRVVIDPRRFKEIVPEMVTQSQIDDHGRIHEEIGRNSVTGLPVKTIVLILLVGGIALAGIAAIYFLFLKPEQPQPQQAASLIGCIHRMLLNR